MRVVAWNCNTAFHRKYRNLLELKPDIAVIPECANVELLSRKAPDFQPTFAARGSAVTKLILDEL
jgi:hypothetical protein